ncbi:PocR ligand-binding domain-containing protein [Pseudoclostridium thermosuccinogenes]|uniref:PocR ligand-binding domain-containing protein n=1 Tax=Clostridium thermosuccinogenes TaxID=84032 RepID=UPI000CCC1765|nr:PocR ligand-binding domain-containing protein [Pseudoclostridium thermosuccinogenes]PNT92416.1 hypothetical protein CDQ83_02225 [Pseudoclostridium thermosuccinogenes]
MELGNGQSDVRFDLKKAIKCVDAYSKSVGIDCIIIDSDGNPLYLTGGRKDICIFCSRMQNLLKGSINCSNVHLYGSYQAERFGGKYVFFCPMGMVHWASPISVDGSMQGAVLAGPVHMVEPDQFPIDDIASMNQIEESHLDEFKMCIEEIPVIRPDVVENMSELLLMVAEQISAPQSSKYFYERESQEQQSDISKYLQHIKTMGGNDESLSAYPIEKEEELLSLISIGDKAGSQKVLNEIFGYIFFSSGGNFEVIKARVLELIVLLSRAALKGGADVEQIFGLNYKYLSQINSFHSVEELTYWLSKIMMRFTDCVFNLADVKHIDVIYKAVDYIKRNYMKKITLEEVAANVYLSPSYFSKIFKDEMKCNFNNYLNQIRIEVSKKLLADDSIALVDIANLVGYEDQSYFTKVFKKLVGISPGKFREARCSKINLQQR